MTAIRPNNTHGKRAAWLPTIAISLGMAFLPIAANATAGKILFALGDVNVDRAELIPAKRGMEVIEGDTVITGAKGRAQLKMNDGGKISVRPSSEFKIETFTLDEPVDATEEDAGESLGRVTDDGDTAVYKLLKGGFRTVTGVVGKREGDTYRVETPVATIGIRGTDFTVVLCEGNCSQQPGTNGAQSGVFVGVSSGHVVLGNGFGDINLFANETGFVGFGQSPVLLDVPVPPVFEDLPPPPAADEQDEQAQTQEPATEIGDKPETTAERLAVRRSPSPPEQQETPVSGNAVTPVIAQSGDSEIDLTDGEVEPTGSQISMTYSVPDAGLGHQSGVRRQFADQYVLDASGNLSEFDGFGTNGAGVSDSASQIGTAVPVGDYRYAIGTANQLNRGFDPLTSLRWGRWSGGEIDIVSPDGTTVTADLSHSSLHWVITPSFDQAVLPITGTAHYTLVGNTDPTDLNGNVGSLGSAAFSADFTNASVHSDINLSISGEVWNASGSGSIGTNAPNHFSGAYTDVVAGSNGIGGGNFTGFFSADGDTTGAVPQGAGLTYTLEDITLQTQISGAAVFGSPE